MRYFQGTKIYGIWCKDTKDWLREYGGVAILCFESLSKAKKRAAGHYGFKSYFELIKNDWAEVVVIAVLTLIKKPKEKK